MASSSSHWLPPSMRKWLDDSARNAWKKGLSQALNSNAHIGTGVHGRGEEIANDAIKRADAILSRRGVDMSGSVSSASTSDGEAEGGGSSTFTTHMKNIALAIGTYSATLPYVKHENALEIARDLNGALASRLVLAPIARLSMAWTMDPYARMARSLRLLRHDYGDDGFSFDEEVENGADGNEIRRVLRVTRCLYRDVLDEEEVPSGVLDACCCSVDKLWFEAMAAGAKGRVNFKLTSCSDDGSCSFHLQRPSRSDPLPPPS